jgi:tetratricopeptide (TPR) repeat protein
MTTIADKREENNKSYFNLAGLAIIIFLGIIISSNSFSSSFHFDDIRHITGNKMIRDLWDKAVGDFSRAIELNPGYFDAYLNRGVAYINLKKIDQAVADFSKAGGLLDRGVYPAESGTPCNDNT